MAPTPETVKVFVIDQQLPTPGAILGVLVRFFNAAGTTFITQDVTVDVSGDAVAEVTLDGDNPPITYTIRLSKTGVAFDGLLGDDNKSPQKIEVYSPPSAAPNSKNDFEVKGETFAIPTATDPRLCRCSGFFKRPDGLPYTSLDILFVPKFKPTLVDGDTLMGGTVNVRTDSDGFAQIDLYRTGLYKAYIESLDDTPRDLVIPDASSESLSDLLFPVVESVVFAPASLNMSVDDTEDVIPTVTASDQRVLDGAAGGDVKYVSADESVATVSTLKDKIVITAVGAGTTQVDVERLDESVVIIPDTPIVFTPLSITVT